MYPTHIWLPLAFAGICSKAVEGWRSYQFAQTRPATQSTYINELTSPLFLSVTTFFHLVIGILFIDTEIILTTSFFDISFLHVDEIHLPHKDRI
jgi:hypothetical protein